MKNEIHDAFDSIKLNDSKKEKIYYEIQRNYEKKGYISSKKLHFFKQTFDRFVPAIALCILLLVGFSFYGVTTGLFTGVPYKSTEEIIAETADTSKSSSTSTAPAPATARGTDTPINDAPAPDANTVTDTVTANIYSAFDIGYTLYVVEDLPNDPMVLWNEIINLKAVPQSIALNSYTMEDSVLVLDFNKELQTLQDSSATTAIVCGIAKTYDEFYPENESLAINSGGAAISFQGEPIDIKALLDEHINITDTKNTLYQPQE